MFSFQQFFATRSHYFRIYTKNIKKLHKMLSSRPCCSQSVWPIFKPILLMHVYMYVCMYKCIYVCMYVCMYVSMWNKSMEIQWKIKANRKYYVKSNRIKVNNRSLVRLPRYRRKIIEKMKEQKCKYCFFCNKRFRVLLNFKTVRGRRLFQNKWN